MAENLVLNRLLDQRQGLLDLGVRNRLINVPMRAEGVRIIEIVDETPREIYRSLIEGKGLTFLPGRVLSDADRVGAGEEDRDGWTIPQPPEREADHKGAFRHHTNRRLQTRLTSEVLHKRLFDIGYDARTLEEEQGVNVLFLAIGLLRWFEDDRSDVARHAPLILLPVRLERDGAGGRFTLRMRDEPASSNLSLQAKLREEFGLAIEDFADGDEADIAGYLTRVAAAVSGKARWKVLPDAMVLGLFSFSKFLMYRDLDPANWPEGAAPHDNALVAALLGQGGAGRGFVSQGFADQQPILADDGPIDDIIPPAALNHVVDADASQAVAIEEALRGRNLVIAGPPGTGKSQTITNIIAGAVLQGKKVLFVAEKMTALDVVQRRLRQVGLGPMTLELHSAKTGKRALLDELRRTLDISSRPAPQDDNLFDHIADTQAGLNHHAAMLHEALEPSGLTPYQLLGRLLSMPAGGRLVGSELAGAARWTAQEARTRFDLAAELADRLKGIGDLAGHDWRGVGRDALAPGDRDRLTSLLQNIEAGLDTIGKTAHAISQDFAVDIGTLADIETLSRAVKATLALPPQVDRNALAGPVWRKNAAAIGELILLGRSYRKFSDAMALAYRPEAWRFDLRLLRDEIAAQKTSWIRFLKGPYRDAMEQFRSLLVIEVPADRAKQLSLLDGMISAQETRRRFEAQRHLGADAFGTLWLDDESDWDSLQAVADWWRDNRQAASAENFAARLAVRPRGKEKSAPGTSLVQSLPRLFTDLAQLQQFLRLDLKQAFGVEHWAELEVAQLTSRLKLWLTDLESLLRWISFGERCRAAREAGLGTLVDGLLDGRIAGNMFVATCERAYYESLREDFLERLPDFKRFDGELQDLMVESFRVLDHGRIALARETIATRHLQARLDDGGNAGALGVLNAEFAKKHDHLPIRRLLEQAGPAIQQLKPVLMMSPLSVSHFLKPGALTFDLLLVDEASQIEPLALVGAMARAGQLVVVGDERQMPPTRFFTRLLGDAGEQEDEEGSTFQTPEADSVLDLCLARGMPSRLLDRHYRSRHPSLIAVSNSQFYGNRLMVAPSPHRDGADLGLVFRHLPQAHYDRGNTRTNPREAKAVAEAVMAHARNYNEYRDTQSLGVVTFSVAQRQAILRELELLRRASPESEAFFNSDSTEPFFVKNLENVQGDERDVILISVGYGRNAEGHLAMNFGPLNREGGERRLNVLISRARYRCEVFSSITAEDIDADRGRSDGVAALKTFLDFARNGRSRHAVETATTPDTLFEDAVAAQLRARGHTVATRVGSAGFPVDLAVVDPEQPERFVLAIECDGVEYHAARSARDRDRLRPQVLGELGWIVHRIWSVDWFRHPDEEIAKVEAAIIKARLAWQQRDDDLASPSIMLEPFSISEPEAVNALSRSGPFVHAEPDRVMREPAALVPDEPEPAGIVEEQFDVPEFDVAAFERTELKAPETRVTMSWPSDLKPAEPRRAEPRPAEPRPAEPKPIDTGAALFQFPEFGPAQARTVQANGMGPRPVEPKAAEPKPSDLDAQPIDPQPFDFKPAIPEPIALKPIAYESTASQQTDPAPVAPKPVEPSAAWLRAVEFAVSGPGTTASSSTEPEPEAVEPDESEPAEAAGSDIGEPHPAEEGATHSDFVSPGPVDPRPADPRSVDPRSVAPRSVAPRSVDPRSVAPRPGETKSSLSQPYVEAVLQVSTRHELQELSAARMAIYVAEVVRMEGPVHEQEIIARIRGAFGLGRAGVRVREAVLDGIDAARITGKISGGPFYTLPGQRIAIRDRSQTTSPGLRKLDMLPPQEIEAAVVAVIRSNLGTPRETLLVAVSRALGFAATSAPLRERLEEILDTMLARRQLAQRNNLVVAVQ